ncbi:MAG: hypothetical protein HC836_25810 [Richelia sp. RM2_1_2]|nr:hypothetical protein [Richelia sp. RM2_1_2]
MDDKKIIKFPVRPKEQVFARCPKCMGFQWEIEVDKPEVTQVLAFHCATVSCGYKISLIMTLSPKDLSNDMIFNFDPDPDNDIDEKFIFTLEDDDDTK